MKPAAIRIEPVFSPRLWGSRSLAPLYPEKSDLAEPLGEAWLTGFDCRIASPPFTGKTLTEMWREMPAEWRGDFFSTQTNFPLLVKFIFPQDKLSIQVHPNDAYAAIHERNTGGRGKTEMWHAVSAGPEAQVLVGLKPDVTKEKFLEGLAPHTLEDLFQRHTVRAGDTFFVPAGTPHTIGSGMVLCEVQEHSDLTYRVYDYGRLDATGKPRELHIEKALEVMQFGKTAAAKIAPLVLRAAHPQQMLLAACRHFAAERWEFPVPCEARSSSRHFELLVILSGTGRLQWQGDFAEYHPGECWFVPATLGDFSLQPAQPTSLLRAYVPDLAELRSKLQNSGIDATTIARALFD